MKKFFALAVSMIFASQAQAGLYLEPYLGYAFGSSETKGKTAGTTTNKHDYNVPYLGGRVGYGMMGLSLGLDYSMTLGDYDIDVSSPAGTTNTDKYANTALGVFANFDFPVLPLRVWGTYFLDWESETKTSTTAGNVGDTDSGKGIGLGVGFTGLPFLAINLELRKITIDESKDASTGVVTAHPTTAREEPKIQEIILSVSAPFDF
jgi:hypothetical protein